MMRMMKVLVWFAVGVVVSSCSSKVNDTFHRLLSAISLKEQSALVLISNSTAESQAACTVGNRVVVQRSLADGRKAYCRDKSYRSPELRLGEVCPGGANVTEIKPSGDVKECTELTVCGVLPVSVSKVGDKAGGTPIDELLFTNLPWGCNANVEFSFDPSFPEDSTGSLKFYVQPPDCPFCERQNRPTCLPCTDLGDNERIQSGQVVNTTCPNGQCRRCEVLRQSGTFVNHGEGKIFFKTDLAACGLKCSQQSMLRMCNDGLWQGDPAYDYPQCFDTACGCRLPGDTITYAHNASKTIYKAASPACGIECDTQSLLVHCNDGKWEKGDMPRVAVMDTELATYPARTCSKRVCHCERPGREIVPENTTKSVYSKNITSCTERCGDFQGAVTCNAGVLTATEPRFLAFAHDTCTQEDCGCRLSLADGNVLLSNGGTTTVYQYAMNTIAVPDACTNPAYQVQVSCTNKNLSAFNANLFKYKTCNTVALGCTFTDGQNNKVNIPHLGTITVSKNNAPACGEVCENLELTCENQVFKKTVNGTLTTVGAAELALYRSATRCLPKNCDCTTAGGDIVAYGSTMPGFYKTDKVTDCNLNGCVDARASLTCTVNGLTSSRGDNAADYKTRSCEVIPCGCPVPWGGTIESGRTVRAFSIERSTCADPTACSRASSFQNVTCTNGTLSNFDPNVYRFPTCSPQVCECTWGLIKVPFGGTLRVYKLPAGAPGETCRDISTVVTCNADTTWTGGSRNEYPYTSCVEPFDEGQGGGTGGGTGNDEGPGAGLKRRVGVSDPGDAGNSTPCTSFASCRADLIHPMIPQFVRKACLLPWGGGEIEFYGSVSAFDTKCVTLPQKCSDHRILRTCHFPKMSGSDAFKYPTCEEKAVCP